MSTSRKKHSWQSCGSTNEALRYNPGMNRKLAQILVAVASIVAFAACGGDSSSNTSTASDAAYTEYFAKLAPAVTTLQQALPDLKASATAPSPQLAADVRKYSDALNTFSSTLDKIDAPGQMQAPHKTFTKQSTTIANAFADVAARLAPPSHTPTQDELAITIGASGAVVQWVAACQRLQEFGRTKGATLDFKCATLLGIGTVSG